MNFQGEKITDLRWERRMKQQDLAKAIGVKQSVVSFWEHNHRVPSSPMLLRLSKALGVAPEYFFADS